MNQGERILISDTDDYTTAKGVVERKKLHRGFSQIFNAALGRLDETSAIIPPKDFTKIMQNDYYVLAHEQASRERADLRTQIEQLLARDSKLEKLVDCLKEFLPEPAAAENHSDGHHEHNGSHEHHG